MRRSGHIFERRNQQQVEERDQYRREGNRREAVDRVEKAPCGSAGRESDVHGRADPSHHLAGVLLSGQCQPPVQCTRHQKALGAPQKGAAQKKDRERERWRCQQGGRHQIENTRCTGGHQSGNHHALGAPAIGEVACGEAGNKGRGELTAGDEPDQESAVPQSLVDVQRQHRHGYSDHQIAGEDHRHHGREWARDRRRADVVLGCHHGHRTDPCRRGVHPVGPNL